MKLYGVNQLNKIPELDHLTDAEKFEIKAVSEVLPFRTNNYVVEELIDWNNYKNDPMFLLTFMQKDMLSPEHYDEIAAALKENLPKDEIKKIVGKIRNELNPHPAGQSQWNVPKMEGTAVAGIQHKYKETCLVFPSGGQTCFAYCTFCFRWAQFVDTDNMKFITDESRKFQNYLKAHNEITDVLFTGGDPLIMSAKKLISYIEPLLEPEFDHIKTIRLGTKALSFWPYRFLTDKDSEDLLNLFRKIVSSGKHLAFMAHVNHPIELSTDSVKEAIRKIRGTGAEIRTQSPLLKHINDDPKLWSQMWEEQVQLGCIPYYMFVERDTGARPYFEIPLHRAWQIYQKALQGVSGLARTARGPSMSALPGKVNIEGVAEIKGEKVFVLTFLQGRHSDWVKRPFFAKFDPTATWFDQLKPAFGEKEFFFEKDALAKMSKNLEADKSAVISLT